MNNAPHLTGGFVSLVGAGPGDPGLVTEKGLSRLREAEVVVFDALAPRALLDVAPPGAERIDAGKRARRHRLTQDETQALLAAKAEAGKRVVRLKGGDPYLFGRGAEEMAYLGERGIRCEVIPGVTAGIAAPMTAGIPVTHREHASSVTFVTGHEDPSKGRTSLDYPALAALVTAGGTLCFYMGVGRLPAIREALVRGGLDDRTPAAVVASGTLPQQRAVRAALAELPERAREAGVGAPAIIVVGAVAGIEAPGLDYFTRRPLFGRRVAVTRTRQQASALAARLAELGAEAIEAPTIAIEPAEDPAAIDRQIARLADYDWLVLTSANGVEALAERLASLGLDARALAGVQVAVIGDATAGALAERLGIRADLVPESFVAEALAEALLARAAEPPALRVLLLRADIARPALREKLEAAGATVEEAAVYRTVRAGGLPEALTGALEAGSLDWVTFTSSSTARNLVELLGERRDQLAACRLASIGPITSATLRSLGFEPAVEATRHDVEGLVEAILAAE